MTLEEEIDNAWKEYCADGDVGTPRGEFEYAINWAVEHPKNPWISVEDRLPPEDKDNNGYSVKVIGMFASGHISDCFCSLEEDIWFIDIFTCDKPTHWMPIPELKKGE